MKDNMISNLGRRLEQFGRNLDAEIIARDTIPPPVVKRGDGLAGTTAPPSMSDRLASMSRLGMSKETADSAQSWARGVLGWGSKATHAAAQRSVPSPVLRFLPHAETSNRNVGGMQVATSSEVGPNGHTTGQTYIRLPNQTQVWVQEDDGPKGAIVKTDALDANNKWVPAAVTRNPSTGAPEVHVQTGPNDAKIIDLGSFQVQNGGRPIADALQKAPVGWLQAPAIGMQRPSVSTPPPLPTKGTQPPPLPTKGAEPPPVPTAVQLVPQEQPREPISGTTPQGARITISSVKLPSGKLGDQFAMTFPDKSRVEIRSGELQPSGSPPQLEVQAFGPNGARLGATMYTDPVTNSPQAHVGTPDGQVAIIDLRNGEVSLRDNYPGAALPFGLQHAPPPPAALEGPGQFLALNP